MAPKSSVDAKDGILRIVASYPVKVDVELQAYAANACQQGWHRKGNTPLKAIELSCEGNNWKGETLSADDYFKLDIPPNDLTEEGLRALLKLAKSGHLSSLQSLCIWGGLLCKSAISKLPQLFDTGELVGLRSLVLSSCDPWETTSNLAINLANALESGALRNLQTLDISCRDAPHVRVGPTRSAAACVEPEAFGGDELVTLANSFRSRHATQLEYIYLPPYFGPRVKSTEATEVGLMLADGHLPALKLFVLFQRGIFGTSISEELVRAVAQAYKKNRNLTAAVWEQADSEEPALAALAVLQRRNVEWVKSLQKLREEPDLREREPDSEKPALAAPAALQGCDVERVQSFQKLREEPDVPGKDGKIFLCGNPGVGKTTLRYTFTSTWKNVLQRRRQVHEPTRGIEVSSIKETKSSSYPIELKLWDLAGQQDYQVLHSAFLPDLALADGRATFFVIVCRASRHDDFASQQRQLLYWLRFISSNSTKDVAENLKRRVFVALNCFDINSIYYDAKIWNKFLGECQKEFERFLNIFPELFCMDARIAKQVKPLKERLTIEAKQILQDTFVPEICHQVWEICSKWADGHKSYPVMQWLSYCQMVGEELRKFRGRLISEEKLEAATVYLHQVGRLILFRRGWQDSKEEGTMQEGLVIMDAEWFCRDVVGHALLPREMLRHGETCLRSLIDEDGSLPIATLQKADLNVPEDKREELVEILLRLGMCYKIQGETARDKIFVPALMKDVPSPWCHGMSGSSSISSCSCWVMGYSLVLKGSSWLTTLLPVALLRKLQVDLAQDKDFGRRFDASYAAGKFYITLRSRGMDVLVEFSSDAMDSERDRIDILVKPLVCTCHELDDDSTVKREHQVNLAHEIVRRILVISYDCCPGIELERRIVKPWSIVAGYVPLRQRDIQVNIEATLSRVQQSGPQRTNWKVGNKLVKEEDLLSEDDLRTLYHLIDKRSNLIKVAVDEIIFPGGNGSSVQEGSEEVKSRDPRGSGGSSQEPEMDPQNARILQEIKHLRTDVQLLSGAMTEMKRGLRRILEGQRALVCQVQCMENFSVGIMEKRWPQFAYLAKPGAPDLWMRVKEPFREVFTLHFLCEAPCDGKTLHEVEGQVGVDVKKMKDWAQRLAPILDFTLRIAFVAAHVAGAAYLPGITVFLPDTAKALISSEAQITQSDIINSLLHYSSGDFSSPLNGQNVSESQTTRLQQQVDRRVERNSANSHMPVKVGRVARAAIDELLGGLRPGEFETQVGLRRVKLDRFGTTQVVWICDACFFRYGCPKEI